MLLDLDLVLTTYHLLLTTQHSVLTTYYLLLTTYYLLLTTYYLFTGMLLDEGRTYCALVVACTEVTPSFPTARCANVSTTGTMVDLSAPFGGVQLLPQNRSAAGSGSAMPLTVAIRCSDPQSGVSRVALSLGTERGAANLADGMEIVGPLATNISVPAEDALRLRGRTNRTSVAGRVSIS